MQIAVIGAGHIGRTIGQKWAAAGHEVVYGVRDPKSPKLESLAISPSYTVRAASPAEAISEGEVILLAVPGSAVSQVISDYGKAIDGKIIIDATNRVGQPVMNAMGLLAEHTPSAAVYRAFSHLGWENFQNPLLAGSQIDLFYCGTPGASQAVVDGLIAEVGLRPVYCGGPELAESIDHLTRLWFALVRDQGYSRRTAFKLIHEGAGT